MCTVYLYDWLDINSLKRKDAVEENLILGGYRQNRLFRFIYTAGNDVTYILPFWGMFFHFFVYMLCKNYVDVSIKPLI